MDIKTKSILIVEDDDDSRFFMLKKLKSCGYHVLDADNGDDALRLAKEYLPDLIITDILMPKMDGNQLIKELKKLHSCKDIPVFVISIRKNMKDYFDALDGVSLFIAKPFSLETLVMQVDDFFQHPPREIADPLKKILIAGSNVDCIESMAGFLRDDQYHVDFVTFSEQIISKAVLFFPNIFIFEVQMYGVQASYEVVKILRQMPQFRHVPILLYCVFHADPKSKDDTCFYEEKLNALSFSNRCIDEGANEYMGNFDKHIFLETVSRYLKKGTIVVIDDDKGVLTVLKNKLEKEGYKVFTASDGDSGIKLVKRIKPELVMLDIVMPDMDGYEVLGALKEDPCTKDVPVVMLTVKDQDQEIKKALDIGAKDYILKPFHIELLLKRVANHLEE